MSVRLVVLHLAKWFGLFRLSRFLIRNRPLIFCYHGCSFVDEHEFNPMLFMRTSVLDGRLSWLRQAGYNVITLQEVVEQLKSGRLPKDARVLTIDDGFFSTFQLAAPLFKKYGFPCTVYITTYYVMNQSPIFRLAVQYMFWKTEKTEVSFEGLGDCLVGGGKPTKGLDGEASILEIIEYGENTLSEDQRAELCTKLGRRLVVDYQEIVSSRRFSLMNVEEIRRLESYGLDIQLHTHRHRMPAEPGLLRQEIIDNRSFLVSLTKKPLRHLCYPGGRYSEDHWPIMKEQDIVSATVCKSGMVSASTNPLRIPRILDADSRPQIVFEAEVCGFKPILNKLLKRNAY